MQRALLMLALALALLSSAPVYASTFGVSPSHIELDVPTDGAADFTFRVLDYIGDVRISTEGIPLRISPTAARVSSQNNHISVSFYGDGSKNSTTYEGKILFTGVTEQNIGMGVKVKARITNVAPASSSNLTIPLVICGAAVIGAGAFALARKPLKKKPG